MRLIIVAASTGAQAQSLFDQLYGPGSGANADSDELYRQGEDAPYLASRTLWESQRVRALAASLGIEAALAEDETIRHGDVISTSKGLMVFMVSRNSAGVQIPSLVPLNKSPLRSHRRLQAIDEVVRRDWRAPK